jgi:hypothetical protein
MECNENKCETGKKSSCQTKKSCCSSGCPMTDGIIQLAEESWSCLMKEKMNKVAEAGVKASITFWENKMKSKGEMHKEFENIKRSFMGN